MIRSAKSVRMAAGSLVVLALTAFTACSAQMGPTTPQTGSSVSGAAGGSLAPIKIWIEEDLPDRVAATKKIVAAYTAKTGAQVDVVSISEDEFNQLLTTSAAAGDLPDVIGGVPAAGPDNGGQRVARHRRDRCPADQA